MKQYQDLLRDILENGRRKGDRTGTGTISLFGAQMRFNLQDGFPLVTTKKCHLKSIIHELLWFLAGDTNTKYLNDNGVSIWDEWALKEDGVKEIRLSYYERMEQAVTNGVISSATELDKMYLEQGYAAVDNWLSEHGVSTVKSMVTHSAGDLGPIYGKQWRAWEATHPQDGLDVTIDQIQEAVNLLKNNPNSRRIIVSAWNPNDLPDEGMSPQQNVLVDKMALAPCHCLFQFYTDEATEEERIRYAEDHFALEIAKSQENDFGGTTLYLNGESYSAALEKSRKLALDSVVRRLVPERRLSCQLYQRSVDSFLGLPFNIASYALLTLMVSQCVDMIPGDFVWTGGDTHIYLNHLDQVNEQLSREPKPLPIMRLNPEIKNIDDFKFDDFTLFGYDPHPAIKAPISI